MINELNEKFFRNRPIQTILNRNENKEIEN